MALWIQLSISHCRGMITHWTSTSTRPNTKNETRFCSSLCSWDLCTVCSCLGISRSLTSPMLRSPESDVVNSAGLEFMTIQASTALDAWSVASLGYRSLFTSSSLLLDDLCACSESLLSTAFVRSSDLMLSSVTAREAGDWASFKSEIMTSSSVCSCAFLQNIKWILDKSDNFPEGWPKGRTLVKSLVVKRSR